MKKIILFLTAICAYGAQAQTVHTLPPLLYSTDALEPVMSRETVELHHGKHVQAYVDNLNKLIPGTPYANASLQEITRVAEGGIFNNGAQILNHIIFFNGFAPESRAQKLPSGPLAAAIERDFGSFEEFRTEFNKAANGQFGSGWAWLATDRDGKLQIMAMSNAGNPIREGLVPILGIDVWEHSYYVDYRNKRADYMDNIWRIIDWMVIGDRYDSRAM